MKRPTTRRRKDQTTPLSGHDQMLTICAMAEGRRERDLPAPLPLPVDLDPAVEEAVEQLDRAVAALVRLLAGPDAVAIVHAMLALQVVDPMVLMALERAYAAADDPEHRRRIIVALGLLRRQGVPRAGASLLRIGQRESDESLREAVLMQVNDTLAESFWDGQLRPLVGPGGLAGG